MSWHNLKVEFRQWTEGTKMTNPKVVRTRMVPVQSKAYCHCGHELFYTHVCRKDGFVHFCFDCDEYFFLDTAYPRIDHKPEEGQRDYHEIDEGWTPYGRIQKQDVRK